LSIKLRRKNTETPNSSKNIIWARESDFQKGKTYMDNFFKKEKFSILF